MAHGTNFHIPIPWTCAYDSGVGDPGQKEVGVVNTETYGLSLAKPVKVALALNLPTCNRTGLH